MNSMYDILNKMKLLEGRGSKPDFLDLDKDGNKKEPMKKAAKEKIDELSPATIASYQKKAYPQATTDGPKSDQRAAGMVRSLGRPTNEGEMEEADYSAKKARAGKDIGKPGKNFEKIAKGAAERYGSKERGEKVAGAVLAKLRAKESVEEAEVGEGNDFTGARLAAIRAGKPTFRVDGKTYKVTGDTSDEKVMEREYGQRDEFDRYAKKGDTIRTTKGTLTKTDGGVKHERRPDDEEGDEVADAPKRGRGRPKGPAKGPERVTAKAWKHKAGRVKESELEEDRDEEVDAGEFGREGDMAKEQMHTIEAAAEELSSILSDEQDLPEWVQKKITLAMDYIDTARDYMKSQGHSEPVAEKAVSKAQRAAAGIAYAAKKGDLPKSELRGASKEMAKMPSGELKKFAKTKEKGLPEKKKEESVEETTVAGSVATAPSTGKASGIFGKGVYESKLEESYKSRLETMLTEGMSVNMSADADGKKSLTVTATDEDAVKLSQILTLAGMEQGHTHEEVCPSCGQDPCGCDADMMEEDLANAPDEVYASTEVINNQGDDLHKRKSTGQTTLPTPYLGADRQNSVARVYEEVKDKAESRLWDLYNRYDNK